MPLLTFRFFGVQSLKEVDNFKNITVMAVCYPIDILYKFGSE